MSRSSLLITLVLLGSVVRAAEVDPSGPGARVDLKSAWQFALRNSVGAREAESLRQAGLRDRDEAATAMLPHATLFGGYNANNYENADSGFTGNLRLALPSDDLSRQLFRFHDRAVLAKMGELRARSVLDQLRFQLLRGYCQYHLVAERLALQKQAAESFGGLWQVLDPQTGGAVMDATLLGDLVEDLERIEGGYEESQAEQSGILRSLRQTIGAPIDHPIHPAGDLVALVARLGEFPTDPASFSSNPELELADESVRLARSEAVLKGLRRWPQPEVDFDLSLGPEDRRFWFEPSAVPRSRWQVVGGLRWNLLDWGSAKRELQSAVDRRDVAASRATEVRRSLESRFEELRDKSVVLEKRRARLGQWTERLELVLVAHGAGEPGKLESLRDFVRLSRRVLDLKVQVLDTRWQLLLLALEARRLQGSLDEELPSTR